MKRRSVMISRAEEFAGYLLNGAAVGSGSSSLPLSGPDLSFFPFYFHVHFSANHLLLLSRTEHRICAVFHMQDNSTHRVYRLYYFTKPRTDHVRANITARREGSQCGQTAPGHPVGQDGHQT